MRLDTKLVMGARNDSDAHGSIVAPIHMSATYEQRQQSPLRYFYGRGENPTREALEASLAGLEDAAFATTFASGQAAAAAALSTVASGRRVLASDDLYGGTYALLTALSTKYGLALIHR